MLLDYLSVRRGFWFKFYSRFPAAATVVPPLYRAILPISTLGKAMIESDEIVHNIRGDAAEVFSTILSSDLRLERAYSDKGCSRFFLTE
jgi:hypothetical protein